MGHIVLRQMTLHNANRHAAKLPKARWSACSQVLAANSISNKLGVLGLDLRLYPQASDGRPRQSRRGEETRNVL
jgi:hypothetical protein